VEFSTSDHRFTVAAPAKKTERRLPPGNAAIFLLPGQSGRVIEIMNKYSSLKRSLLVAVALGALGATVAFAQTAPGTPDTTSTGTQTPSGQGCHKHKHHDSILTQAERAELKTDSEKVFASNPNLKTQETTLKTQFKSLKSANPPATKAQWASLKQQHEALKTQMRTAIEGVDSGAAALFQKLDAAKGQGGHHHHSS
jgi:hypothetical protein